MSKNISIPIVVQDHDMDGHFSKMLGAARTAWPVRVGVPLPSKALRETAGLTLWDGKNVVPFEAQITNRWPDGSIRWMSVLALVDLQVSEKKTLTLTTGKKQTEPAKKLQVKTHGLSMDNGVLQVTASSKLETFQWKDRGTVVARSAPVLELELKSGGVCRPKWQSASIEVQSDLRSRMVYRGEYAPGLEVEFAMELTAGQPWVECSHRITHKATGQPRITICRLSVQQDFELPGANYVVRQSHRGESWLPRDVRKPGRVDVNITASRCHVTDHTMVDEVVESYPPYLHFGLDDVEPWVALSNAKKSVLFWTPEPLGYSPQAWHLDGARMTIDLIPEPVEFPQGRAKTHKWRWHCFDTPAEVDHEDPRTCYDSGYLYTALLHGMQPMIAIDPGWSRSCGVMDLPKGLPYEPQKHPRYESVLTGLFELGWPRGQMNYGDDVDANYTNIYTAMGVIKDGVVWTNNEYDFLLSAIHHLMRSGQGRLWPMIERSAQHALDIDFMHFSDDPWLQHGSPAHSLNHTTASSYPSHIWTEGLLHYYYLTGDKRALEVATLSGKFILRYIEKRWWVFESTARESGWPLLALVELYHATGDCAFLDGARKIKNFFVAAMATGKPMFPGEASFFIGVLVMGLNKLHDAEPDPKIPKLIDMMMQWRLDNRMSPEGMPLYHWNAISRMASGCEIMFPAGLAIAYRLTGKIQYLDALIRILEFWQNGDYFHRWASCTKTSASFYRSWVEAFHELSKAKILIQSEFPSARIVRKKRNPRKATRK